MFWLATDGPLPAGAYAMQGAGGQVTWVVPTHDLVVVRLGHFKGQSEYQRAKSLDRAIELLLPAIPTTPG